MNDNLSNFNIFYLSNCNLGLESKLTLKLYLKRLYTYNLSQSNYCVSNCVGLETSNMLLRNRVKKSYSYNVNHICKCKYNFLNLIVKSWI